MSGIKRVAEFCFRQGGLLCHQFLIFSILYDRYAARDAGFAVDKTPWEHANCYPAVEQQVNFTAQAFGMDDAIWEHLQVHKLVLAVIEESAKGMPYFFLNTLSAWRAWRGIQSRMMVFMGWSALPQSTPIQRSFFFLAHSANSRSGPGCMTM